jgi:hypothetical protein
MDEPTSEPALSNVSWCDAIGIVRKLHRHKKLEQFMGDWRDGVRKFTIEPPELIEVAAGLIDAYSIAEVWPLNLPSAPTAEQIEDPTDWIDECVAEARSQQEKAKQQRSYDKLVSRELVRGGYAAPPLAPDERKGTPVYRQKLKQPLDKMLERLKETIAEHEAERGEFDPKWLDPHQKHFIKGGVTNKHVIMMASAIEGPAQRPFEDNWAIVKARLSQPEEQPA